MKRKKKKQGITLSKGQLTALIIVIVVLVTGGVVLGLNWNKWFGNKPDPQAFDVDPNAGEWTGEKTEDTGGEAVGIKIPGYPSITVPADKKDVDVAFLNPEGNPCYFTFELVLKDTQETIYQSKLVPPGEAITRITMAKPLKAGEHEAVIKISTTSVEDGSAMNGADVETVLIAE